MVKLRRPRPTPDVKPIDQLAEHDFEASRFVDDQARGTDWGCSASRMLLESFSAGVSQPGVAAASSSVSAVFIVKRRSHYRPLVVGRVLTSEIDVRFPRWERR